MFYEIPVQGIIKQVMPDPGWNNLCQGYTWSCDREKTMTGSLWKDLFREIRKNKSRFLSIFFIVALGVAFLAGVRAAEPDMLYSVDRYYDDQGFMDLRVISTLGLTGDDVLQINAVKGVDYAVGGRTMEVFCHFMDYTQANPREETKTIKVYEYIGGVNEPEITAGKAPEKEDECLIDYRIAESYDVAIGDTITLISATEEELADSLKQETYIITGIGKSPWYLTYDRGTGSIGNGKIDYFMMIPGNAFVTDVFSEIYVQVDGAEELISGSDAYDDLMDAVASRIEALEDTLGERRLGEVKLQAREEALASEDYEDAYEEAYADAYEEAYNTAYEEALNTVKSDAREQALETAKSAAYDEALAQVKAEALEEALTQAKETAREEALQTAKAEAHDTALEQVKEEAKQAAWEQLVKEAYELALAEVRSQAYAKGLDAVNQKAAEIVDKAVSAYCDANNDRIRELLEQLDKVPGTLEELEKELSGIKMPDVTLPGVDLSGIQIPGLETTANDGETQTGSEEKQTDEQDTEEDISLSELDIPEIDLPELTPPEVTLPDIELPEITLPDADSLYLLVLREIRMLVAGQEISEIDQEELSKAVLERITPQITELYDEYFNQQFDSVYKTLFDLQFEDELRRQYGGQFDEEFEKTFAQEYQAQFDAEFEKTFNEQYLDSFNEQFDATFDTQYAPLVEYQFEKTFAEEYQAQFDEEFEKTFEEEYLDTFNEEFEKTFASDYQQEFDDQFKETFENDYLDLFNEEFDKSFNEEFEKELEEELASLSLPTWYVLGRGDSVASYIEYIQDADAIGKIGKVFPLMFFLVAALVALTTMTRMVEDERSQIGTLKALGYSNMTIAGKYLIYTLLAAIGGSILGSAFGEAVFPFVIMNAYGILFSDIPGYYQPFQWDIAIIAGLAAVGCILFATLAACLKSTAAKPAALMRPPAPKAGKRIFLEYLTFLWKHLSFTAKASVRNLFRYKKRLFMTVFGIGGCMALLLVGLGLRDSILTIAKYQYRQIFTYDVSVSISADATDEGRKELYDDLDAYKGITDYVEMHTETIDAVFGENTKNLNLYVPEQTDGIDQYISLKDRVTHEEYVFPENGVAISEKTAKKLGASVGDIITLRDGDNQEVTVEIVCIFENYLNHYVLMSREIYEELFDKEPSINMVFTKNETRDEAFEEELSLFLMEHSAVNGIALISGLDQNLEDMLGSLDVVVWVLIVSAALLAFVVLYNLNNINISERRRELATIKVLGFYHGEVAAYVYRDNIWLTVLGCIVGIFLGKALHMYVITTVEVEIMMFGRNIAASSYIYSILFTALFSAFVNFMMYFQLKKINMVESLKSVE